MPARKRYAEDLRAIGQALAAQGVAAFELYSVPAGYFVRDLREETTSPISKIWNWLRRERRQIDFATYGFEFPDVEELSKRGRARRSKPGQIPQFREPSNILRMIGTYIETKNVEFLELHNRPISVTLVYRDRSGREYREDRPISSFQKVFVGLIEKRISHRARP
jgi:hypothetical protein